MFLSLCFKFLRNLITKIRCNEGTALKKKVCLISEYLQPSYFQAAIFLPAQLPGFSTVCFNSPAAEPSLFITLNIDALLPVAGPRKLCFHSHCYTCRPSTTATADEVRFPSQNYSHYSPDVHRRPHKITI